jgi:hypothetical protein
MSLIFIAICAIANGETLCHEARPMSVMVEVAECNAALPAIEASVRANLFDRGWVVTSFDAFCESGAEG